MERVQSLRHLIPRSTVVFYKSPLLIERGEKQWLFDQNNKKYLDFFGGIVTVSVGHCHPKVQGAVEAQLKKLWHTTSIYLTRPIFEYAEKLTSTLPPHLNVCLFTNSGSEANDLAIELARLHTGRFDMLSLRNGYHGMTQALAGATDLGTWKQPLPQGFGIYKSLCPDPYRGIFTGGNCRDSPSQPYKRSCSCKEGKFECLMFIIECLGECQASDKYVEQFEDTLNYDFPKATGPAAFLAESIQGVGGTVQFPRGFLKRSFEATKARGGLCISDEVQTGFGRLGSHFWGFESQDAQPDIVTMAKGIANGFPMGAVVTTKEIADSIGKAYYFNTFGGNPLSCTAAQATLEVIKEEKLQENCAAVGTFFIEELKRLPKKWTGDVRGKGLMVGIELINEEGKALDAERVAKVFEKIKDLGVLNGKGGLNGNILRFAPPMCITKEDVQFCVEVIDKAIKETL
ncbi:hypothetical protein M3Y97_00601200 [Aphelenchoides bicaudatus]|nr:hypothetical protein M3Y97_00601200 [Aphelenchoides bicaudatus]